MPHPAQFLNQTKLETKIRGKFAENFNVLTKNTPGRERFSAAFQEELTKNASEYTAWWNKLHPGEAAAIARMTPIQQKRAEAVALLEEIQTFVNDLKDKDISKLAKTMGSSVDGIKDAISGEIDPLQRAVRASQAEKTLKDAVGGALAKLPSGFTLLLRSALSKEKFSKVSDLIAEVRQFHAGL